MGTLRIYADNAYIGKQYLALFEPDAPAGQLLHRRYPERTNLRTHVERICRDEALGRPFYPVGGDQDIEGLLLQWNICLCIFHSGVSRYNEDFIPDRQAREELRTELAKDLAIQRSPAGENLKESLPQLWQKRTAWEEARAAERPHPRRDRER